MSDCYVAALRILNYRFNSEAELRRKLRSKKFDDETIAATIEKLRAEKWLDDERFAGAFVRTRASKKIGSRRIARELQAAGVRGEAAERAVEENVDRQREAEDVKALCERKSRALARRHGAEYVRSAEGRAKLASWLIGRGYDDGVVWETISECGGASHRS